MGHKIRHAIGYVRVSTEGQSDNTSLQSQRKAIREYAERNGYTLAKIYSDIESGKHSQREGLKNALVHLRQVEAVLAVRVDRVSRDARFFLNVLDEHCRQANKRLHITELNVDERTPVGKLVLTVMAGVAEFEHSEIVKRTQDGRRNKKSDGGYSGGAPAYGQQALDKHLRIKKSEQRIIELCQELNKTGYTLRQIAAHLNLHNIKSKRNRAWHPEQVRRILTRGISKPGDLKKTARRATNDLS